MGERWAPTPGGELAAVELRWVRLPLRQPHRAAHGTEAVREVVLVRAFDADGAEGWGECSALSRPTYTAEHTAGAFAVLRDVLVPAALAGEDPVRTHPMAAAALECARVDLFLRREGRNLAEVLGGARRRLPTTAVVGGPRRLGELLEEVGRHVDEGAAMVKLKVEPGWDTTPLTAVRSALPDLPLAADANGAYGDEPERALALDDLGLAYLEQPLPADDLRATASLAERLTTPVALDESAPSPGLLDAALALGAGSVVNVKPARVGGLAQAGACATTAIGWNARCFVGGMLETGVGRAAALAVAASSAFSLPTDLGPSSRYFDDDVTEPLELDGDGLLVVPSGPGLGVTPRPDRLEAVTVRAERLRP